MPSAWDAGELTVSIHAPREGERPSMTTRLPNHPTVSIHAPREGERPALREMVARLRRFQSTLPARGSDKYRTHTSRRG